MKPLKKTSTLWSAKLAYAIGLITTDGNLSKDGRHITFVSKDLGLIKTFNRSLGIKPKICLKKSGFAPNKLYYYVQFGDKNFYEFLTSINLTAAKSKTLGRLVIPKRYFFDFLRGCFDGDGSFYSYWDKRWASSFLFYLSFISASLNFLNWLRQSIRKPTGATGHIDLSAGSTYQLKYAKKDARLIIKKMYHSTSLPLLKRKYTKVMLALSIDKKHSGARVLKPVDRPA